MAKFAHFLFLLSIFSATALAQTKITAEKLLAELACMNCHAGIEIESAVRAKAPDLSHAGLRFNPAYLFDYLQNPTQVRRHIGLARMPNFHFSPPEALTLVLFLEKQIHVEGEWPDYPVTLRSPLPSRLDQSVQARAKDLLAIKLQCTKCHKLEGRGENQSTDLSTVGYRLQPEWLAQYLVAPHIFDGKQTTMPGFFYQLDARQKKFVEMIPQAQEAIIIISQYLFSLPQRKREELEQAYQKAKDDHPRASAELGEKIFRSQNCVACHRHSSFTSSWKNAPDLSLEGTRVKKAWLESFLRKPAPIRPFGFHPGSGSRMPDFNLAENEVRLISRYLLEQKPKADAKAAPFKSARLSAFAMNKAHTLLKEKLSCLGCHRLGNEGGRIGPNLSSINKRLQNDFVAAMIQDPQATVPHAIMPKIVMPPKNLELITNFLLQQEIPRNDSSHLSLLDYPITLIEEKNDAETIYARQCALCHGLRGESDGYNAKFLPKPPTKHADRAYMSQRPDDTLYDGVYAGGYILNKSHMMPPWGHALKHEQIQGLVAHMRKLCGCEGPAWSRDGK